MKMGLIKLDLVKETEPIETKPQIIEIKLEK